MGNSPLSGQGASEPHDQRDVDGTEFQDVRPKETKTKIDEASDSKPPQWRPNAGPEDLQRVAERPVVDGRTAERTMCPEVSSMSTASGEAMKSTPVVRRQGLMY